MPNTFYEIMISYKTNKLVLPICVSCTQKKNYACIKTNRSIDFLSTTTNLLGLPFEMFQVGPLSYSKERHA